jgi:hypothetical protein
MAIFTDRWNLFAIEADLYVITVNTVGAMGAGLALAFKKRYYDLFCLYRTDCFNKNIRINKPVIYQADDGKHFMMFPTKANWRNPSRYDWIAENLHWMTEAVGEEIDPSWVIAMPPLGCSNGGLEPEFVADMIEEWSGTVPNTVLCTRFH